MEEDKNTVTKAYIVERVHEKVGFTKKQATEMVENIFGLIKGSLCSNEKVKIAGFGNFSVRDKRSRKGRNPQNRRNYGDQCTSCRVLSPQSDFKKFVKQ